MDLFRKDKSVENARVAECACAKSAKGPKVDLAPETKDAHRAFRALLLGHGSGQRWDFQKRGGLSPQ